MEARRVHQGRRVKKSNCDVPARARSTNRAGYNKAAKSTLDQSLKMAPNAVQVLLMMGKVQITLGDYQQAEVFLLRAKKASTVKVPEIHKELSALRQSP